MGMYWSSFFLSMHSIRIFSNFTNIKSSVGNLAGVDSGSVALLLVKLAATFDIVRQVSWAAIKKGHFFMLAKEILSAMAIFHIVKVISILKTWMNYVEDPARSCENLKFPLILSLMTC